MFKLPKKMLFAIEAVIDIAYNAGGMPVQNNEITQRQGIPKRYLEQVLQKLVRSELLISIRGPGGGYKLARERRRITLGDICRVVKSPNLEKYQTILKMSQLEDWIKKIEEKVGKSRKK